MNINEPQSRGLNLPFLKSKKVEPKKAYRLPFSKGLPDKVRNHIIACLGEFVGTTLFLFFALSATQVANNVPSTQTADGRPVPPSQSGSNPSQLLYISLAFGFSLAVNAWVFFRISGGLFNPAVTLGMCLVGALPWFRGMLLTIVQIVGGIAAAGIVSALFPGPLNVRTSLGGGTSITQGLFIEMFLTFQLVFTIFMLAAEKHRGTFIAPIGIGLSLFIAELTGVYFTGGSLNPARSFGPCVILHSFHGYHWIYWVGPILGSLLACALYKLMKILEYETANPDQDAETDYDEESGVPRPRSRSRSRGRYSGEWDGDSSKDRMPSTGNSAGPMMATNSRAFSGLDPGGMDNSAYDATNRAGGPSSTLPRQPEATRV